MAFTDTQVRQLKAKLDHRYVKTRNANCAKLSYVEGWHAIAEANRIFGFDGWDRKTLTSTCVWSNGSGQLYAAVYTAKVRISVRASDIKIVREGSGTGEGKAPTPGAPVCLDSHGRVGAWMDSRASAVSGASLADARSILRRSLS